MEAEFTIQNYKTHQQTIHYEMQKTQQIAQIGHPLNPNKKVNKRELNGYFFNIFTKDSILLIWEIDIVSFLFL